MWIVVIYLWVINALTLLAFGSDKLRARRRRRRIPERKLLWLAVLGGSPAALLGRLIFGHKSRKRKFTLWLFVILTVQSVLLFLLVTKILPGIR